MLHFLKTHSENSISSMNYENSLNALEDSENIPESKLILKKVKDNKEYLASRERELAEIKKVSGQVLSITMSMSVDVDRQKMALGNDWLLKNIIY